MTNFYVSKTGLDTNTGLSISDSVLTINRAITLASSNDTIYIKQGAYSEYINLTKSGLTLLPYQEEEVTVTVYDIIPNNLWALHEPGIYKAVLDSSWNIGLGRNDVYSLDMDLQEARWPKISNRLDVTRATSAISDTGAVTSTSPIDASNNYLGYYTHPGLTSLPNMTGARVYMIPGMEWWVRQGEIESHVGDRINIKYKYTAAFNASTDALSADDPFFLWNKYELLTQEEDYFFDSVTNIVYIKSISSPTNVYVRKRDIAIRLNANNVSISGIKVKGRIETDTASNYITLDNIEINKGFKDWLLTNNKGALDLKGNNHTIINSHIYETGSALINIYGSGHIVRNNILHNDGYAGNQTGIQCINASNILVTRNTLYDTAGVAISIMAKNSEYSYNHTYNVGRLLTDLAAINAWNSGDAEGTVIKWNHVHDVISYYNPVGSHWGGKGIRLDSGSAPLGCSNFKIHNNLVYKTSSNGFAVWALAPSQVRYGDSQIYFVNNTTDSFFLVMSFPTAPDGYIGTTIQNNLILDLFNNTSNAVPLGLVFTNNFLSRRLLSNNLTGHADLKNWIPNPTSPLVDTGTQVLNITTSSNPDIGWMESGDSFVWAGAIEEDIDNLNISFNRDLRKLSISTLVPGTSLSEYTWIKVNGIIHDIKGRLLNPNHTVSHFFNVEDTGNVVIEISFDDGLTYIPLATYLIPYIFNTQAYREGNEIVIKGGEYFTTNVKTLNIHIDSLTIGNDYCVIHVDTSSILNNEIPSIRVINRIDGRLLSYYLEDIETTNRKHTPLHLKMNEVQLDVEGGIKLQILYGDNQVLNQPNFLSINPEINNFIYSGTNLAWFKSHSYIPNSGNNEALSSWPSFNNQLYSLNQSTAIYKPTYEDNLLNEWPGIRFDIDSLVGPSLGLGDYTLMLVYTSEDNPNVSYPRLMSGGTPSGSDWTDGIQLLTVNDTNNKQVPGNQFRGLSYTQKTLDTLTLGSSYKNPAGSNFKGYIYEVIIVKGSIINNTNITKIKDYLYTKYGIYPQPRVSFLDTLEPLSIQLGNNIYPTSSITYVSDTELRIPYNGEVGTYQITVTNPNHEFATLDITLGSMEILNNSLVLLSASQVNFNSTYLNDPATQVFTIRNTSTTTDLTLSNLVVPTGYSLVDTFPTLISPQLETSFTIQLDAITEGVVSGDLTFESSDTPLFTINLTGEVVVSSIQVSEELGTLIPVGNTLTLPNSYQGDDVSSSFTITNNGTGSLILDNFVIDSPNFSNITVFPVTIAPSTSQSFDIGLDTSTSGTKTGILSFSTNDPDYLIYSFNLSALVEEVPLVPVLEITYLRSPITEGQVIDLGSTPLNTPLTLSLNLTNTGTAPLAPSEFLIPSGYTLLTSITTIEPGQSLVVDIQLDAQTKGSYPGNISITYNPTVTFGVIGVVIAPVLGGAIGGTPVTNGDLLDYGTLELNGITDITKTLVISNTGDDDLIINSVTLPIGYSSTPLFYPYIIFPGDSLDLDITLDTSITGTYSGNILIDSNDTSTPVFTISTTGLVTYTLLVSYLGNPIPNGHTLDYGQLDLNSFTDITKILVLTNDSSQDFNLTDIYLPNGYTINPSIPIIFPYVITPGNSLEVAVTISTNVPGAYSGDIEIVGDVNNSIFIVSVTSVVTSVVTSPILEVSYLTNPINPNYVLDYGSLDKDSTLNITKTIVLTNNGDQDLVIEEVTVPIGYSINTLIFPYTILPGVSIDLDVTIDTLTIGTYGGTLSIVSNDINYPIFNITTTGVITSAVIEVSYLGNSLINPASLNYGQLELNETLNTSKTLVIENKGNIDLILNSITVPTGYSINPTTFPYTLLSSQTLSLDLTLDTSTGGTYTGDVLINSNDIDIPSFVISLTGIVTNPVLTVSYLTNPITSGYLIDYGPFEIDSATNITKSLVLTNDGNQDFNLTSISLPNGYTTNPIIYPYVITPGNSLNVDVTLNTSVPGAYSGDIEIADDDINTPIFVVGVTALVTAPVIQLNHLGSIVPPNYLLDYGDVEFNAVGPEVTKTLVVTNIGNQDLILSAINLPAGYSINSIALPLTLAPTQTLDVIVTLATNTPGAYTGPIEFISNAVENPVFLINTTATVTTSDIDVSHLGVSISELYTLDFGSLNEEAISGNTQTLVITNPGNQDLVIQSITLPNGYSTLTTFPLTIVPSVGSVDIPITLATDTFGTYSGQGSIVSDAYGNPEFLFNLTGVIVPTPPTLGLTYQGNPISNGDSLPFGNLELNSIGNTVPLTVTNIGSEDLVISSITLPSGYTVEPSILPVTLAPGETLDIVFTLATDTPGVFNGLITLSTNDPLIPLTMLSALGTVTASFIEVDYLGNPIAEGYTLSFGELVEGDTTGNIQSIVIRNTGTQNLVVSTITLPAEYSIPGYNYPMVIAPSGVFNIPITLDTNTSGDYQGQVVITSDAYSNPEFIFNVEGVVIPDVPILVITYLNNPILSEATIPFGQLAINEVNQVSQLVKFTNEGTKPLLIESITVPQGYYINQLGLPFNLLPNFPLGLSLIITLDTNTPGDYNGVLTLNTNDLSNPLINLNLTGSVLGPTLYIEHNNLPLANNDSLVFGQLEIDSTTSNSKLITITNTGNEDLLLNSFTLPPGYTINSPVLPYTLTPGSNLDVSVTLDTTTLGQYLGNLVIASNIGSVFNVALSGTIVGIPIPVIEVKYLTNPIASGYLLDYSSVEFGSEAIKSILISNIGALDLNIDSITVPTGYSISPITFPQVLTPSSSGLVLDITLDTSLNTPTATTYSGDVLINSNDLDNPIFIISLTGIILPPYPKLSIEKDGVVLSTGAYLYLGFTTELVPITTNLELVNTGTADLTISSIVLSNGFSTNLFTPVILIPNQSLTITLNLDAQLVGVFDGNLELHSDDEFAPYLLSIHGEVLGTPSIIVTHETNPIVQASQVIDYGLVELSSAAPEIFTITNNGTATLTLSNLVLPSGFLLTGLFPINIEPSQSVDITLSVDTATNGLKGGVVSFNTSIPSTFSFNLTATVYTSELIINKDGQPLANTSTLDFGEVIIPSQPTISLELINEGIVPITLSNLVISSPFTTTLPAEIAPGETYVLEVVLISTVGNDYTGTLSFTSTDTNSPNHSFNLLGTLIEPYFELSISNAGVSIQEGGTLEFGSTPDNIPITKDLVIRNTGNVTLNVTGVSIPTGYNYTGSSVFSLEPNEEISASVSLLSGTENIYQGEVSFTGDSGFNFFVNGEVYLLLEPEIEVIYEGQPLTQITVLAFGSTLYAEPLIKTLTINNPGDGDLILDDFVLPLGYSYLGTVPLVVPPGGSASIEIQLDGSVPGPSNSVVSFSTNIPETPSITTSVSGEVLAGELQIIYEGNLIEPSALIQYGDIYQNQPSIKSLVLNNIGTYPLNITSTTLPTGYIYAPILPIVIEPGATSNLNIELDTGALGEYLGQLIISNDSPLSSFILYLEGRVIEIPFTLLQIHSEGQLLVDTLDLGTVSKSEVISKILNVSNLGNEELTINSIVLNSPIFTITYPTLPLILGPTVEITIEASNDVLGTYTGELILTDSEGTQTLLTLSLLVEGVVLDIVYNSNPLVSGDTVDFGSIGKDQAQIVRSITFTNSGNIVLSDLGFELDSTAYLVLTPITPIAPGKSLTVDIALLTNEEGIKNGGMIISGNSLEDKNLQLTGEILLPLLPQILVEPVGPITIPLNTPVDITLNNNSPYPITIDSLVSSTPGISLVNPLPITIAPGESAVIPVIYESNTPTVGNVTLSFPISGSIGDNPFNDTLVIPGLTVPALPTVISIGANDPLSLGDNINPITITSIPEGIVLKLGGTPITEGQVLTPQELSNLTMFSINPGEYQIGYELNGIPQVLDLAVKTGPLLPLNGETGYIPIPKYEGLYPSSPYWVEGDTYWVLVEPGMSLSTVALPPTLPPANLILDTIAKIKEPEWRNNKPLTVVQGDTTVYMVGTIDRGLFDTAISSRDIFVYYSNISTIPNTLMVINGIILNKTNLNINGVTYSLNLTAGVIRVTITPYSITIINNGVVKRVVATSILWLPKGSIYTLKATHSGIMQDLLVTVDASSTLINSYMTRKYLEGGDYISLLTEQ